MNWLDAALVIPLVYGAFKGFKRGLIVEVATLVALILGIWGALECSFYAENLLDSETSLDESYLPIVAFATTFIAIVFAVHLLARVIHKLVGMVALGLVNRIVGCLFGIMKFALILSFLLILVNGINARFELIPAQTIEESLLYTPFAQIGAWVIPYITDISWFQDMIG